MAARRESTKAQVKADPKGSARSAKAPARASKAAAAKPVAPTLAVSKRTAQAAAPKAAGSKPTRSEAATAKTTPAKASGSAPGPAAAKRAREAFPATFAALRAAHPDAHCELDHQNAFQLIVATVLSAQSTDVAVNRITPDLFARWPDAKALSQGAVSDVEAAINRIGMFRQKAKNLVGLAQGLVARHGGKVPDTLDQLVALPGVGRKTANVVLGVAFGKPEGVVVDTHVQRIAQRLGWTRENTPEKIEQDLMQLVPRESWDLVSHTLIFHGRRICSAQRPACAACPVNKTCPSAFAAEDVGRKPPRSRPR